MRVENKDKVYKVMFCKSKTGSWSPRISIPDSILRDLNIRPGDSIQYIRTENGVILKRWEG